MKRSKELLVAALLLAPFYSPAAGFAAQPMNGATDHSMTADKKFLSKAAEGGLAEVKLSEMAQGKTANTDVKRFADQMVTDHSAANEKLKPIAEQQGVTVSADVTGKNKQAMDKLAKLSGAKFDKAYMEQMVTDHEKTVKLFQQEASSGKVADVKSFANDTLPTLQQHLEMAKNTKQGLK